MNFSVQNKPQNPAFKAIVVKDKSFEPLGKFANEVVFPKLQKAITPLGSDELIVTLKGQIFNELSTSNKILVNIKSSSNEMTRNCEQFLEHLKPTCDLKSDMEKPEQYISEAIGKFVKVIEGLILDF